MRTLFLSICMAFSGVLAGCGFTPLHQSAPAGGGLQQIVVDMKKGANVADNKAGFLITQRLRDRVGTPDASAKFTLEIKPEYSRLKLGVTDADVASRYDVTVQARWVLINTKTGREVKKGRTSTVSTFGAPSGPFGVITADNVGVEQASQQVADKMIIELARHFAGQAKRLEEKNAKNQ